MVLVLSVLTAVRHEQLKSYMLKKYETLNKLLLDCTELCFSFHKRTTETAVD